jgi:hypothetical protein
MKVKIVTPFHDKFNQKRVFWPDEVVVFEDRRAADLIARGLATPVQADAVTADAEKTDGAEEKKVVESAEAEPLKEDSPEETVSDNSNAEGLKAETPAADADAVKDAEDAVNKAKEESEKEAAEKIAKAKAKLNGKK